MKATTNRKPSKAKKPAPLKVTITGSQAERVRTVAKQLGISRSECVANFLPFGFHMTGSDPESKEYQLDVAADYVGLSRAATAELHAHAERASAEYLANLRKRTRKPQAKKGGQGA